MKTIKDKRIEVFPNENYNDRNTINTFQWIFNKNPALRDTGQASIILRITAHRQITDSELKAMYLHLGLSVPQWKGKWMNPLKPRIVLLCSPTSNRIWPDVVELSVDFLCLAHFLQTAYFTLTAKGYKKFADTRFLYTRRFPFLVKIDEEYNSIGREGMTYIASEPSGVPFSPRICIADATFTANELRLLEHIGELSSSSDGTAALLRLYYPKGIPAMEEHQY